MKNFNARLPLEKKNIKMRGLKYLKRKKKLKEKRYKD